MGLTFYSIVAVHGLHIPVNAKLFKDPQSFGARTWAAGPPGDEKLWLKDFLPDDIPDARVFLFGYNSNVGLDTSIAGTSGAADDLLAKLRDQRRVCPDRPLMLLCHSLGGIVVKQAVAKARSSLKYAELFHSMRAVAFFATPHRGGLGAAKGRAAAGFLRRFTGNQRSSIMEALLPDSFYSYDIHQAFLDSLERIHICTFYEMKPIPGLPYLIVSRNSAVLGLPYPNENVVPIPESNHSTICKYDSRSQSYVLVIRALGDLVQWTRQIPSTESRTSISASSNSSDDLASSPDLWSSDSRTLVSSPSLEGLSIVDSAKSPVLEGTESSQGDKSPDRKGPFYLLPSIAGRGFIGRKAMLNLITSLFSNPYTEQQCSVAICGLGGSGKTQVARQVLSWYRRAFPDRSIFWIQAGSADLMRQSLTEIGVRCGLIRADHVSKSSPPLEQVRQFLMDPANGRWLICVDNADTIDAPRRGSFQHLDPHYQQGLPLRVMLAHFIPKCPHGHVLYTTRSKAVGERLTDSGHVIETGSMDQQDSHELLRSHMARTSHPAGGVQVIQETLSDQTLEKLSTQLNGIPLALSQAAAFMRQQNLNASEYLKLVEQDESRLTHVLEHDFLSMSSDDRWSKAVASVWNLTFDQIDTNAPEASELLSFVAFLSPQEIPKSLLRSFIPDEWTLTTSALGTLQSYALVNVGTEPETFNMHLLVQLAVRRRLESAGSAPSWLFKVLELISEQFPRGGYEVWPKSAALLPHALQVLSYCRAPTRALPLEAIAVLEVKICDYYRQQWRFSETQDMTEHALRCLGLLGPNTKELKALVLDVKYVQVWNLKDVGDFEGAEALAKEVWLERQHLLGAKHTDTLMSHNVYALMLQQQGKLDEAAKAARSDLKILQKTQADDDWTLLETKRRLGTILHKLGELNEAHTILTEAFEGVSKSLGPRNIQTFKVKWCLAWVLRSQGKYAEAEKMNRETLEVQRTLLGENHEDTLKTLFLLAGDLQAQGKYDEALASARKIYDRALASLGRSNQYTSQAASSLASCLASAAAAGDADADAKLAEAEILYRSVLSIGEGSLRPNHPETLRARTDVATVVRLRGDPAAAEEMERETLKRLGGSLGDTHGRTLASREGLARALWAQREAGGSDAKAKAKEAAEQARRALKVWEKRVGWSRPETRRVAKLLIEMLVDGKERERLMRKLIEEAKEPKDE